MTMPTLLIVDDNPSDVDLLRDVFTDLNLGVDFMVASDGQQAMAILEQIVAENRTRPSAILLDLNMPRISGHEVLAYIKETAGLM
jgi:two-component system, chemotaxis family, response regulator Rcp1